MLQFVGNKKHAISLNISVKSSVHKYKRHGKGAIILNCGNGMHILTNATVNAKIYKRGFLSLHQVV